MDTVLSYQPVTRANWTDLEQLFESRGGPSYCWCMAWRPAPKTLDRKDKDGKKALLQASTQNHIPIGILGYAGEEPVAWCSIAPRETYRKLGGDIKLQGVWSLVCMFVKRTHRGQGHIKPLIRAAIAHAKQAGAQYVEAYPVTPDSPSYRFMGIVPTFEALGFQYQKDAGSRRKVMLLDLFPE